MFSLSKKVTAPRERETVKTLANLSEDELSDILVIAKNFGIQVRDMRSGFAVLKNGKRVGYLTLDTLAEEVSNFWLPFFSRLP